MTDREKCFRKEDKSIELRALRIIRELSLRPAATRPFIFGVFFVLCNVVFPEQAHNDRVKVFCAKKFETDARMRGTFVSVSVELCISC